uniref:Uncharacterized protein n=1 Tax=Chrysemys picta bellii TaxID=8478 RepID=A0A8C3HY55_CHRPI
ILAVVFLKYYLEEITNRPSRVLDLSVAKKETKKIISVPLETVPPFCHRQEVMLPEKPVQTMHVSRFDLGGPNHLTYAEDKQS